MLFCTSPEQALAALHAVEAVLSERGLRLNADKTYVASFDHGFTLLGWRFQGRDAQPEPSPIAVGAAT